MTSTIKQIAYLGPKGTFSELVARKRFGRTIPGLPLPGIYEVFEHVRKNRHAVGIVPIENSSGGNIYETIDCLIESGRSLVILEELSLQVRLALLGHRGKKIRTLYSHFAPMQHCDPWISAHLPKVERKEVSSTAMAADMAARNPHAAALGMRDAARQYGLDVLEFPVQPDVPNLTQFICIGHKSKVPETGTKTSMIVTLDNRPGALCDLLAIFRDHHINMTRILSRPIIGKPKSYIFFIDIDGAPDQSPAREALKRAAGVVESLRYAGAYPVRRPYIS